MRRVSVRGARKHSREQYVCGAEMRMDSRNGCGRADAVRLPDSVKAEETRPLPDGVKAEETRPLPDGVRGVETKHLPDTS